MFEGNKASSQSEAVRQSCTPWLDTSIFPYALCRRSSFSSTTIENIIIGSALRTRLDETPFSKERGELTVFQPPIYQESSGSLFVASLRNQLCILKEANRQNEFYVEAVRQLRNEIAMLGLINNQSPQIVYYLGALPNENGLILEFAHQGDLFSAIAQERPFKAAQVYSLFSDLFRGLEFLHGRGILHRDIKPENLLVGGPNGSNIRITDFGFAHQVSPIEVVRGVELTMDGTVYFFSREVLSSRRYSEASDMHAAMLTIHFFLFGRLKVANPPDIKDERATVAYYEHLKANIMAGLYPDFTLEGEECPEHLGLTRSEWIEQGDLLLDPSLRTLRGETKEGPSLARLASERLTRLFQKASSPPPSVSKPSIIPDDSSIVALFPPVPTISIVPPTSASALSRTLDDSSITELFPSPPNTTPKKDHKK